MFLFLVLDRGTSELPPEGAALPYRRLGRGGLNQPDELAQFLGKRSLEV